MTHLSSNTPITGRYQHLWPETARRPLLGFAAWSGTGKTTLLSRLIPLLRAEGLRIGLIKHAHHQVEVDQPGKDSHRLRKAGAEQVLLTTSRRWALMTERPVEREPELTEELRKLDQETLDLILVEGFRDQRFPKIELLRNTDKSGRPPLYLNDDAIIALATDGTVKPDTRLPVLDINSPPTVAAFIIRHILDRTEMA